MRRRFPGSKRNRPSRHQPGVRLSAEPLEPRMLLAGLVEVGTQPEGVLTGKTVYVHAGHGWTANNLSGGAWSTQRPETFEMIEDLGNQDQLNFFADYLFRAGATVVPLRPIGHQPQEVVLDNDDGGVTFAGGWSNSSSPIYYGAAGDLPYRFASTSLTETAYARYRPNIPSDGFYPIYAWTRAGSDRASDQLYRVAHTGGITEVTINHRAVGNGLVYLGTYYFAAGTDGYVDISNRSTETGRVVIADMIRFGNGMGDISRGGGVSNVPREDESGLYWIKWHVDRSQGVSESEYRASSDDRTAAVTFSPRYAEYMNRETEGSLSDRVFVSFHSNAGGGSARGVLGLYNGNNTPSSATPNQFLLANTLASEVNADLVAQAGQFEHNWANRSVVTLDRSDIEFGEINNAYVQNEFDATIIETGFHDNQLDAEMLRDPRVRDALARATYQGVVRYFRALDGTTPLVMAPAQVADLRAESLAAGTVRLTWTPPSPSSYGGDAPTAYRVYVSEDGYGFDGGTLVAGGATATTTLTGLEADRAYYFKVVALNAGGESPGSAVVAALPGDGDHKVLIVNGFDRFDRTLNPRVTYTTGTVDRVRPRNSNSFDYAVQVGEAIESYTSQVLVDTVQNEAVRDGTVNLADYDSVVWILGEESSADSTFDALEQSRVAAYLAGGGNLFTSGAEIGWDLDQLGNGGSFYNNDLKADYVADDSNTYSVQGQSGSIFAGLSFSFDNGSLLYDVTFPDVISPTGGSSGALSYVGGTGGTAAIEYAPTSDPEGRVVMLGFPFETITSTAARAETMQAVLEFFGMRSLPNGDFDGNGQLDCDDLVTLTVAVASQTGDFDLNADGLLSAEDILFWITDIKGTLPGDANLDFVVDTSDFNIWNAGKFSSGYWCTGDFTGNLVVDTSDFNVWNANKFKSVAPAASPALLPPRAAGEVTRVLAEERQPVAVVVESADATGIRPWAPLEVRPNPESERTLSRRRDGRQTGRLDFDQAASIDHYWSLTSREAAEA